MKVEVSEFEQAGAKQGRACLFTEYWCFLSHNKKWWLLPILLLLALFGALLLFSGSAAAPFIYTLF
jgi:hypothetical protein